MDDVDVIKTKPLHIHKNCLKRRQTTDKKKVTSKYDKGLIAI